MLDICWFLLAPPGSAGHSPLNVCMFKMPLFSAWRRGVSEVPTFKTHLQGFATSKGRCHPHRHIHAVQPWLTDTPAWGGSCLLYTCPSFFFCQHRRVPYSRTQRQHALSFMARWKEWECCHSFSTSCFRVFPITPFFFFSKSSPLVRSHLIKASHSHQAPTLPHKLLGMPNLSLMSSTGAGFSITFLQIRARST